MPFREALHSALAPGRPGTARAGAPGNARAACDHEGVSFGSGPVGAGPTEGGHHVHGKRAIIPLAPRTSRVLDLYLDERTTGPIFLGAKGGRMDRYAVDRMVKRLARRAGITKRISPHSLRHSFITAALDAGVPLRDVQEAASHADPRTTMRYDRGRGSLDRHATYIVATFLAAASR